MKQPIICIAPDPQCLDLVTDARASVVILYHARASVAIDIVDAQPRLLQLLLTRLDEVYIIGFLKVCSLLSLI